MNFKKILRRVLSPPLAMMAGIYLRRERFYSYGGIRVRISPGVFHPGLFFSTKILLHHLLTYDLRGKRILELGAGSGLISISAAARGALVTATDISTTAIDDLRYNSALQRIPLTIIQSDLFDGIPDAGFDMIIVNPPYYPRDPVSERDLAWYCGGEFQYFRKLFTQLQRFRNCPAAVLMILSEDCALDRIRRIASDNGMELTPISGVSNWFERNEIYSIGYRHPGNPD